MGLIERIRDGRCDLMFELPASGAGSGMRLSASDVLASCAFSLRSVGPGFLGEDTKGQKAGADGSAALLTSPFVSSLENRRPSPSSRAWPGIHEHRRIRFQADHVMDSGLRPNDGKFRRFMFHGTSANLFEGPASRPLERRGIEC